MVSHSISHAFHGPQQNTGEAADVGGGGGLVPSASKHSSVCVFCSPNNKVYCVRAENESIVKDERFTNKVASVHTSKTPYTLCEQCISFVYPC
jgi:hypothetical protein